MAPRRTRGPFRPPQTRDEACGGRAADFPTTGRALRPGGRRRATAWSDLQSTTQRPRCRATPGRRGARRPGSRIRVDRGSDSVRIRVRPSFLRRDTGGWGWPREPPKHCLAPTPRNTRRAFVPNNDLERHVRSRAHLQTLHRTRDEGVRRGAGHDIVSQQPTGNAARCAQCQCRAPPGSAIRDSSPGSEGGRRRANSVVRALQSTTQRPRCSCDAGSPEAARKAGAEGRVRCRVRIQRQDSAPGSATGVATASGSASDPRSCNATPTWFRLSRLAERAPQNIVWPQRQEIPAGPSFQTMIWSGTSVQGPICRPSTERGKRPCGGRAVLDVFPRGTIRRPTDFEKRPGGSPGRRDPGQLSRLRRRPPAHEQRGPSPPINHPTTTLFVRRRVAGGGPEATGLRAGSGTAGPLTPPLVAAAVAGAASDRCPCSCH